MPEFDKFGNDLRAFLTGLLAPAGLSKDLASAARPRKFDDTLFAGALNRMAGSGGELLVKGPQNSASDPTKMEVGDRLIGIGATHTVENLSQPPGPEHVRVASRAGGGQVKMAMRAFAIADKTEGERGINFRLAPLAPKEYSELVAHVSGGLVTIPPSTIPKGTMIVSFIDDNSKYTLKSIGASASPLFAAATTGERYWTVGVGRDDDFWEATFPSDESRFLRMMESSERVGSIRFGLTLLDPGASKLQFGTVSHQAEGRSSQHEFVLSGSAAGTMGLDSPFPIGLRTEIVCRPQ